MNYRGIEITLRETENVLVNTGEQRYEVNRSGGLVFAASSKLGVSYASDPESALSLAKKQIDEHAAVTE